MCSHPYPGLTQRDDALTRDNETDGAMMATTTVDSTTRRRLVNNDNMTTTLPWVPARRVRAQLRLVQVTKL